MIRSVLKGALPRGLVQFAADLRRLESSARGTFVGLAWRRRLGVHRRTTLPSGSDITVIAICHGNIMRSAYAEALLTQPAVAAQLPGLKVSSAGLHAIPGQSADPRGLRVAAENGVDLSRHRATLLDARLVSMADLLLVMDHLNVAEVVSRHPDAASKVVLLGSFDPLRPGDPVISDPYTGKLDAVRASYSKVAAGVAGLVEKLAAPREG